MALEYVLKDICLREGHTEALYMVDQEKAEVTAFPHQRKIQFRIEICLPTWYGNANRTREHYLFTVSNSLVQPMSHSMLSKA